MSHRRSAPKRKFYERVSRACDMCRRKKVKCDQGQPCQTCQDREFHCVYTDRDAHPGAMLRYAADTPRTEERAAFSTNPAHTNSPGELGGLDEQSGSSTGCQPGSDQPEESLVSPPHSRGNEEEETVGGENMHTGGTEFYGNSSNFGLLNQLFSKAHRLSRQETERLWNTAPTPALSIVDMLYDDQSTIPDPNPCTPVTAAGRSSQLHDGQRVLTPGSTASSATREKDTNPNIRESLRQPGLWDCFIGSPMRLEMEYVNLFFENIHTSLPFLDRDSFVARCERETWVESSVRRLRRNQMHFFALYNAVLAMAALTASPDALEGLRQELEVNSTHGPPGRLLSAPSSLLLSKLYFWRARHLLGDVCEVCSIDSAQTLLLMSFYCQHALKPHACYMYSGMAVQTALAIGLPDNKSMRSRSEPCSLTVARTWWAIYFQQIEVSCSSGRSNTLAEPSNFRLPYGQTSSAAASPEKADASRSEYDLVAVLVELSVVLQRASSHLYRLDDLPSLSEKSRKAVELDQQLLGWRAGLPPHLNFDLEPFTEPEWVTKQKLTLQLKFYYARMFIHRPFLSTAEDEATNHIRTCLAAARKTIGLIHDAYQHRHYFRTWWYNTICILYAGLIVLHSILLPSHGVAVDILARDMRKALKVLDSMKDLKVAKQCSDIMKEMFDTIKQYAEKAGHRSVTSTTPDGQGPETVNLNQSIGDGAFPQDVLSQLQNQNPEDMFQLGSTLENGFAAQNDIMSCFGDLGAFEYFPIDPTSSSWKN